MLTKKLFLGLGGLAIAAVPVMSVISCGNNVTNSASETNEVVENGIYVNKETGYITRYTGIESVITIPTQIQGVTIKGIGLNAFKNKGLTSITIEADLESIGDYAFANNQLTTLKLSKTINSIGKNAFENNQITSLEFTTPATTDTVVGLEDQNGLPKELQTIGDAAFRGNQISSLVLPESVISLGKQSFENNAIESIIFGNKVKTIEENAFKNQLKLDLILKLMN